MFSTYTGSNLWHSAPDIKKGNPLGIYSVMGGLWMLESQLLIAIQDNDIPKAVQLLDKGVDADIRFRVGSQSVPAIYLCVQRGHLDMASVLLKAGCSINQSDQDGFTPLHIAAVQGCIKMVSLLLKNRANVKAVSMSGETPLHLAAAKFSLDVVELLVKSGSDIEKRDHSGRTPLSVACMFGRPMIVQYLVSRQANVNHIDNVGNSPLLFATSGSHMNLAVVQSLLAARAEPNHKNKNGEAPLLAAIRASEVQQRHLMLSERVQVIQAFLRRKCDLNISTPQGQTPLHLAIVLNQDDLATVLIQAGCNPSAEDNLGLTPLYHAARLDKIHLVRLMFLEGNANVRCQKWFQDESLLSQLSESMIEAILNEAFTVPSLQHLCRNSYRSHLGYLANEIIVKLSLPKILKNYLTSPS